MPRRWGAQANNTPVYIGAPLNRRAPLGDAVRRAHELLSCSQAPSRCEKNHDGKTSSLARRRAVRGAAPPARALSWAGARPASRRGARRPRAAAARRALSSGISLAPPPPARWGTASARPAITGSCVS
ncbi:unnamed protein product [Prorocentrum cordatum]|uniref:Uncharacterized protein n=1 Tax=Prorocentrum cordatum TaxID=2364126 RepID=A0ABN9WLC8_9DINO|nr:unnamed protein product [Polarella glacialis]